MPRIDRLTTFQLGFFFRQYFTTNIRTKNIKSIISPLFKPSESLVWPTSRALDLVNPGPNGVRFARRPVSTHAVKSIFLWLCTRLSTISWPHAPYCHCKRVVANRKTDQRLSEMCSSTENGRTEQLHPISVFGKLTINATEIPLFQ